MNFLRSLSFRLTVYYAAMLLIALTSVYLVSYFLVSSMASRRVDTFLSAEMDECSRRYHDDGLQGLRQLANAETAAVGKEDLLFRMYDERGGVEFQTETDRFDTKHGKLSETLTLTHSPMRQFTTFSPGGNGPVRVVTAPLDGGRWLTIGMSMSDDLQLINASMRMILLVMLATGVLAAVLGFMLSRNALSGILQVERAAADLAEGRIDRRAPILRRGDEVDRLAVSFNTMATRVEALLTQLRDANDQLAHELRSPLTHIRGRAEIALTHLADANAQQLVAGETVEACDRLLRTIDTILELSETDGGMSALPRETVRLDLLLQNACELFQPLAQDAGITLSVETEPAAVSGAGGKLQRLFSNLLDNALKYTPRGGRVKVICRVADTRAEVVVEDTGRGIDAADVPRVFERFYRGQGNQGIPGNGLGLPLARSIARSHGGDIQVSSQSGVGTTFRVDLPLSKMTEK